MDVKFEIKKRKFVFDFKNCNRLFSISKKKRKTQYYLALLNNIIGILLHSQFP